LFFDFDSGMAKDKIKSIAIKLVSSAETGFFYVTRKNPTRTPRKLSLKKVI
jgi:ribosomal protein L33